MPRARASRSVPGAPVGGRPPSRTRPAGAAMLLALAWILAVPGAVRGQQGALEWDCVRDWSVATVRETGAFRMERAPWALRWERTTPTHSDLDGLFAELFRVEDGERTQDQVAAVNTDHAGHEGTVTVEETGTFWMTLESWSEETEWRIEACVPRDSSATSAASPPGTGSPHRAKRTG